MSAAADFLRGDDMEWWDEPTAPACHCAGAMQRTDEKTGELVVWCTARVVPAGNASPTACALASTCGMRKLVAEGDSEGGEYEWQKEDLPRAFEPEPEPTAEESAMWDGLKATARKAMARQRTAALVRGSQRRSKHHTQWGGTQQEWAQNRPSLGRVAEAVQDLCERAPEQWAPAIRRLSGMPATLGAAQRWHGATEGMDRLAAFDDEHGDALNWVLSDEDIRARADELAQHMTGCVARIYVTHGVEPRHAERARARLDAHAAFAQATAGKTAKQVARETGRDLGLWAAADALGPDEIAQEIDMLTRMAAALRDAVDLIAKKCKAHQVEPPKLARRVLHHEAVMGAIKRAQDHQWWRRQLRKAAARIVEAGAIKLGMVNRRTGGYCSDWALKQRREQLRRNAANLATALMRNEAGQVFSLAELAAASVSNPVNRGGELMTRIRGCEEYADAAGHVGLFVTLTCPSAMHRMLSKEWRDKGDERNTADAYKARKNPRYDGVTTPRDAQKWLTKQWAKARAALARKKLHVYGFRVAEPHHDGTPHWHALVWVKNECEAQCVQDVLYKYWVTNDPDYAGEKGAAQSRTNFKRLEKGGAAGYIAKYIAKSIGHHNLVEHMDTPAAGGELFTVEMGEARGQGHERVDAWASRWGIRQFQAIGQPSVTVWREVRRVTEDQVRALDWDDISAKLAWDAAQKIGDKPASWCEYLGALGGVCLRRDQYRLQPACREGRGPNKYGENQATRKVVGVRTLSGKWLVSRRQHWVPVCGEAAALAKARVAQGETPQESATRTALAVPWTGFNNCTARLTQGQANWLQADAENTAKALKRAEDNALLARYLAPMWANRLRQQAESKRARARLFDTFGAVHDSEALDGLAQAEKLDEAAAEATQLYADDLLQRLNLTRHQAVDAMQRDGWVHAPRAYAKPAPLAPQTTAELDAAMDAMALALGF